MANSYSLFRVLAGSKFISEAASWLNFVALSSAVYVLSESALVTSWFFVARLLGEICAGFCAGALAERFGRRALMVTADLLRAAALGGLLLLPEGNIVAGLIGLAFLLGAGRNLFEVSFQSAVPVAVGEASQLRANRLLNALGALAVALGALMGALLLDGRGGYALPVAIDALTFLFGAGVVLLVRVPLQPAAAAREPSGATPEKVGLGAALRYLATVPILLLIVCVRWADAFGSASHNVGMPVYSEAADPARPAFLLGFFIAFWAVGKVAASSLFPLALARFGGGEDRQFGAVFVAGTILMSLAFIGLFHVEWAVWAALFAATAGVGDGLVDVSAHNRLQKVPERYRGRVYGLATNSLAFGFGAGMLLVGPLIAQAGPRVVVTGFHGGAALVCLLLFIWQRTRLSGLAPAAAASDRDGSARQVT